MADTPIEVYVRDDREGQEVRASLSDYKGQRYFSLRAWYPAEDDFRPTKNGLNLPVDEYHHFRSLIDALDAELGYVPATEDPS